MTILDQVSAGTIPFASQWIFVGSITLLIIGFFGTVLNTLVMSLNFKRLDTASSILILSVCCADFLLCSFLLITHPFILAHYGFSLGRVGCVASIFVVFGACSISILTITSLAVERYLVTNHKIFVKPWQGVIWVLLIWLFCISLISVPFVLGFSDDAFGMNRDGYFCMIEWYTRHEKTHWLIFCDVVFLIGAFILTAFCYYQVFRVYRQASLSSSRDDIGLVQKRILFNCLTVTASFIFFWSVEVSYIAYEFFTKQPVSPEFAAAGSNLAAINAMINPFLLIIVDQRLKKDMLRLLSLSTQSFSRVSRGSRSTQGLSNRSVFAKDTLVMSPKSRGIASVSS